MMKRHAIAPRALSAVLTGAMLMGCLPTAALAREQKAETPFTIQIDAGEKAFDSAEDLYGVFFEDINHAADGGLNPELINNRSFESSADGSQNPGSTVKWSFSEGGTATLQSEQPMYATNPHYLRVAVQQAGYTFYNEGYAGVAAKEGQTYNFYMWVRNTDYTGDFQVSIVDAGGNALSTVATAEKTDEAGAEGWTKYAATITCSAAQNGRFALTMNGTGSFDVDFISLMPQDTWKGDDASQWPYGGLRKDLVQALADLHPRFVRFPGGCIVEGYGFANRYQWKNTIGPLEQRQEQYNLWYEWNTSDAYWQSYGLGYHEYFQMCEDIGAEPLPVINCSLSCQYRGGERYAPGTPEFEQEVQDALDLIEYANGDVTTEWGAKRAENGHPEPFNLKYLGIGNENWDDPYWENFAVFEAAIKEVYPDIQIITSAGPSASGGSFDYAWEQVHENYRDTYVDEHFYMSPEWFLTQYHRYDNYDRTSAKVFAGEYAAHHTDSGVPTLDRGGTPNTLYSAVTEAAFLTGVERNSDVVALAAYAPLFAKVDQAQWTPDLIWFDNFSVGLTPNYYVQQMFSTNYGDETLRFETSAAPSEKKPCGSIVLASWNTQVEYDNVKLTDATGKVIFEDDFADGQLDAAWVSDAGTWVEEDGVLKQTGGEMPAMLYLDPSVLPEGFTGGTLTVDATKTGGAEGFLVGYDFQDNKNYTWYNIGGWSNTSDAVETAVNGTKQTVATTSSSLFEATETGKTYALRIDFSKDAATLYKNEVQQMRYDAARPYVYTSVTRDSETGSIFLKMVNAEAEEKPVAIDVQNLDGQIVSAGVTELASEDRNIQNSVQHPDNIVPVTRELSDMSQLEHYTLPAYSVTVLELRVDDTPQTPVCTADAAVRVERVRDENGNAVFHVNLIDAENVAAVQVDFETEAIEEISGESGFQYLDTGSDSRMILCYLDQAEKTFTKQGETTIATIRVSGSKPTVKLNAVKIAASDDGKPAFGDNVDLIQNVAVFIGYDLNGDGKVTLLDVVTAMKYYQAKHTDGDSWETAQIADVNGDLTVNLEDLLLLSMNLDE